MPTLFDRYTRLQLALDDNGVMLITLSNPGKLNATDATMHEELSTIFADIHSSPEVRAVVVTGEGKAFSAGGDLDWVAGQLGNYERGVRTLREGGDIVRTMLECDTPIISAINGVAVGAGLAVALMADISIINEDCRLTDGHLRIGVAAGDHAVAIWPLLCGMAKAKYYLLTSDFIDGREAERIGLVSKAVAADEVLPTALEIAHRLAVGPQDALRMTKRSLNYWLRPALPWFEASLAYEVLNFFGPEAAEGINALREEAQAELLQVIIDRDLAADLALALELADIADEITLPFYEERSFNLTWKANRTEVTEADRLSESAISAEVAARRPGDGLFGEEHGVVGDVDSPWRWVIDPIDGTSNFVRGIPVWATLIALTHAQHGAVVGVVSAPALHSRWWAAKGLGAFAGGRACRVSTVAQLEEAQVCVTFSKGWDEAGLTDKLVALQQSAYRARGFGDFWQHMLVAEGAIDLAIDAIGLAPYDLAAVMVVVEEAGGTFTDRHGARTYLHDSAISSNGLLHHHIESLEA